MQNIHVKIYQNFFLHSRYENDKCLTKTSIKIQFAFFSTARHLTNRLERGGGTEEKM